MNISRLKEYVYLMRWHKPIGILLLLWPTLWALWLAGAGKPAWNITLLFVAGVIIMRSAGCVINDFADRKIDKLVARTRERPLTAGKVSVREALVLFSCLLVCAFVIALQLNTLTIYLAFIGAMLAVTYPFMKRITHLPQVGLGFAFAWGVPMAFAALQNQLPYQLWIVFFAAVIWPIIYDTMYAMVDKADDVKIGVKSTAILFAEKDKVILAGLQLLFLTALVVVGFYFQLHQIFFISLLLVVILFGYQQWLIKDRVPAKCFQAFVNNHWVGMIIFLGLLLNYLS